MLCALLALLLLPSIAGATTASSVPTTMRVAMVVSPDMELYPLRVMDRDALSIFDLVYDSVVVLNDDQQPEPSLCSEWEMLSDGKTWLFTIRNDVYFHDGRQLDAYDVVATMTAIKATVDSAETEAGKGMYSQLMNMVTSWNADDERTLRVRTDRPYYGLLYAMTFPVLQAQSAQEPNPPGTGPYRIDYYAPGDTLWLSGNENWWEGSPPHVGEIICNWYASYDDAFSAFEAEDVDIVMTRSASATRYRGTVTSRANSYDYSTRQLECLFIHHAVPKLGKDVGMRRAISHAINTTYLKTNLYQGMVLESDTLQRPGSWLYNESATSSPNDVGYNPEKAGALLDDLGWNQFNEDGYRIKQSESGTEELTLRLFYYEEPGTGLRKEAANQIASMLRDVGINVRITRYEFDGGLAKLNAGDYDLFLCAVNFDVTPDPTFLLQSGMNTNYNRYRSDDMNKILKELRKATSATDFQYQWYEIQRQMAADVPFIPLYWRNGIVITRYAYSSVRDIREFELLKSIELYR